MTGEKSPVFRFTGAGSDIMFQPISTSRNGRNNFPASAMVTAFAVTYHLKRDGCSVRLPPQGVAMQQLAQALHSRYLRVVVGKPTSLSILTELMPTAK